MISVELVNEEEYFSSKFSSRFGGAGLMTLNFPFFDLLETLENFFELDLSREKPLTLDSSSVSTTSGPEALLILSF